MHSPKYSEQTLAGMKGMASGMAGFIKEALTQDLPIESAGEQAETLMIRIWEGFESTLEDLPFLGEDNPLLSSLVGGAFGMNYYREMEAAGFSLTRAAVLVQGALGAMVRSQMNPQAIEYTKNVAFSAQTIGSQAERAQKRTYPDDWVFECALPQKSDDWDIGVTYTECAIEKMFRKYDCLRFLPYVCLNDYVIYHEMGLDLTRTETLGNGGACCDFRIKFSQGERGVITDPASLAEFRGRNE